MVITNSVFQLLFSNCFDYIYILLLYTITKELYY
jgi:hypothetical protein